MFANLQTYGCKLLKTVQTITTFRNLLADPMGTRRGPPLVRGPSLKTAGLEVSDTCVRSSLLS